MFNTSYLLISSVCMRLWGKHFFYSVVCVHATVGKGRRPGNGPGRNSLGFKVSIALLASFPALSASDVTRL